LILQCYLLIYFAARIVTLIIYTQANTEPLQYVVFVRFLGSFSFSYFRIARQVKATGLRNCVLFERFSVFEKIFTPETLQPIDITHRGHYILWREASLNDNACPGIAEWKERVQASADAGESGFFFFKEHLII